MPAPRGAGEARPGIKNKQVAEFPSRGLEDRLVREWPMGGPMLCGSPSSRVGNAGQVAEFGVHVVMRRIETRRHAHAVALFAGGLSKVASVGRQADAQGGLQHLVAVEFGRCQVRIQNACRGQVSNAVNISAVPCTVTLLRRPRHPLLLPSLRLPAWLPRCRWPLQGPVSEHKSFQSRLTRNIQDTAVLIGRFDHGHLPRIDEKAMVDINHATTTGRDCPRKRSASCHRAARAFV